MVALLPKLTWADRLFVLTSLRLCKRELCQANLPVTQLEPNPTNAHTHARIVNTAIHSCEQTHIESVWFHTHSRNVFHLRSFIMTASLTFGRSIVIVLFILLILSFSSHPSRAVRAWFSCFAATSRHTSTHKQLSASSLRLYSISSLSFHSKCVIWWGYSCDAKQREQWNGKAETMLGRMKTIRC